MPSNVGLAVIRAWDLFCFNASLFAFLCLRMTTWLQIHCESRGAIVLEASQSPYYCAPLVCVLRLNFPVLQTNKQTKRPARAWVTRGGGQTSSVRAIEGGMRHRQLHVFELCQLSFSPREGDYIDWITYWMSLVNEFDKWTSAPLIGSVVTITPSPPLYHLRTFYITRYTFPSTYPSQTMYPFNELQQNRKRTRNKRRGKKGGEKKTQDNTNNHTHTHTYSI